MKSSFNRKIVLLGILAFLICIYCIQLAVVGKNKIKVVSLKDEPDSFVIKVGNRDDVRLYKEGENWFVGVSAGDRKYPASTSMAENMCSAVASIRLLGTVARNTDGSEDRFGLDAGSCCVVTAYKGDSKLRTVTVGKDTSTGRQSYILLENEKTVYLADDALHSIFASDLDSLRSKEVYSLDASEITDVAFASGSDGKWNAFGFVKNTVQDDSEGFVAKDSWSVSDVDAGTFDIKGSLGELSAIEKDFSPDSEKVSSWVRTLSSLSASEWLPDDAGVPDGGWDYMLKLGVNGDSVTVMVHEEEDGAVAECSRSPYLFKIASYAVPRFKKTSKDFLAE